MNKSITTIIVCLLMFSACRPDMKTSLAQDNLKAEFDTTDRLEMQIEEILPTPDELIGLLTIATPVFDATLLSPTDYSHIQSSVLQRIILGIQTTDLAYCSYFANGNHSTQYLKSTFQLLKQQNLDILLDEALLRRFERNFRNVDSLVYLSNNAYLSLSYYLLENDMQESLALISAGAFIEALYLITNCVQDSTELSKATEATFEFKFVLEQVLKSANNTRLQTESRRFFDLLAGISAIYQQANDQEKGVRLDTVNEQLTLGAVSTFTITNDTLNKLRNATAALRTQIISGVL